jgi:hypothetical protein
MPTQYPFKRLPVIGEGVDPLDLEPLSNILSFPYFQLVKHEDLTEYTETVGPYDHVLLSTLPIATTHRPGVQYEVRSAIADVFWVDHVEVTGDIDAYVYLESYITGATPIPSPTEPYDWLGTPDIKTPGSTPDGDDVVGSADSLYASGSDFYAYYITQMSALNSYFTMRSGSGNITVTVRGLHRISLIASSMFIP